LSQSDFKIEFTNAYLLVNNSKVGALVKYGGIWLSLQSLI